MWVKDNRITGSGDVDGRCVQFEPYILRGQVDPSKVNSHPEQFLGGDNGDEPLPALGSAHPINPKMRLDSYSVSQEGIILNVAANYSTDGRFRFPERTQPLGHGDPARWMISDGSFEAEIPYGARQASAMPALPGEAPGTVFTWDIKSSAVKVKAIRYGLRCTVPAGLVAQATTIMYGQSGNIHVFGGLSYLFTHGDVTDLPGGDYEFVYWWLAEPGSNLEAGSNYTPSPDIVWPFPLGTIGFAPYVGPAITRPPFHRILAVRRQQLPGDPPTTGSDPPDFKLWLEYEVDANGWQELVGLVLP